MAGCPAPVAPHAPPAKPVTIDISGAALRGVAADDRELYVARRQNVEGFRGSATPDRTVALAGATGPIAARAGHLYAAVEAAAGASVAAIDREHGVRWSLALAATEHVQIAALAALPDGVVVGGSFAGTLRVGTRVVTSAGAADGFVARVDDGGQLVWLVRLGGPLVDTVQGVAASADGSRIAIAGTFTAGADLLGAPLPASDERSFMADAFAAELDGKGARRWVATFGGPGNDAVAGVALDAVGRVVVAATARATVRVGSQELTAQGAADGLLVWLTPDGEQSTAILVGGADFDGLSAIAAVGDRVVVGGFFSGAIRIGERTLTAGGGDDAFVALYDASGTARGAWQVGGEGREEVVALAPLPGGFVAGVAHTARVTIDGDPAGGALPAPADPLTGAALVVRGIP